MADFTVEERDPKALIPHPMNFRRHPAHQRALLRYSMERFGLVQGVIVNARSGNLIDGHARVEEAIEQGRETIPVNVVNLSPEEERELLRMFDPIGALAETDNEALERLIAEVGNADLERLLAGLPQGGLLIDADPDAIPEGVEPRSKMGDLWRLGEHRLLCGDSTKGEDVARLMGGVQVDLVFTSPPYAQQRTYGGRMPDWDNLMQGVFKNLPAHDTTQVLINLGLIHRDGEWQPYWDEWIEWMREAGWRRFGWYVWDQGPGLPGDWKGRLAPSHEFIFHFNRSAQRPRKSKDCTSIGQRLDGAGLRRSDDRASKRKTGHGHFVNARKIADSVIRVQREQRPDVAGRHPAVFPVQLPSEVLEAFSDPEDGAYDPFAGSGTTIIAGEQTGRVVRCMEIEPRYVDVALARWEQATGRRAELLDA